MKFIRERWGDVPSVVERYAREEEARSLRRAGGKGGFSTRS